MAATPRERVLRALDALPPYLHRFVTQTLDASAYQGRRVAADIGPLAHVIKDEWRGAFASRLDGQVRNYVHELLEVRNRLAHSRPFDDEEARRACDTIRLVAKAVGAPLAEYDRHAASASPPAVASPAAAPVAQAQSPRAASQPRVASAGRRPTQRDVMRAIWARYAPDEERAVREYADAERRGDAPRKRNESGHTAEQYARALLSDGFKKGWL